MLTYFDVVEHLITASFGGPQDAEQRDIRTAVQRAYSELTQIRDWPFYSTHSRIITSLPYKTGTVEVSGSTVTLSGGTWPSWALHAHIRVGNIVGRIGAVSSSTVATLDLPFAYNIQAGSVYTLYRIMYPLPADFRNMDEPSNEMNWWSGLYITPDQAMKLERISNSSGKPYHWTIVKNPDTDGWAIKLLGYPTVSDTVDFVYRRRPRAIRWSGHEPAARAGTISRSTTTVTGSSTTFDSSMVGSVLRVGDTTNSPGPATSLTPYVSETKITAVASATSATTEDSGTIAGSTKYIVTDPLDLAPHMHNAMYSAAEYWLARIRDQKPDSAFSLYQRDLRLAFEMDELAPTSGRSREMWHDGGWRSPLQHDLGTT